MSKKKSRMVWFNGDLVPESEARISIYDSALMFGDMVFEMTRSFNKVQFKLREHLDRLYASIKYVQIPIKMSIDEMEKHVYETVEANERLFAKDDEHRIMIDVTRGLLSLYQDVVEVDKGPNVIIADFPLRLKVSSIAHLYDKGINAVITVQRAIPAFLLEPKVKSRSRLHYMIADMEVSNCRGEDNWALLLDTDGFITEGTGANFFIVKNGKLVTPEPRNILRGISRKYIIEEIAPQIGIPCCERNIEPYDVIMADEAFMTGTSFCILPVTKFNGNKIGKGRMGKITKMLLDKWSENVEVDIISQIKEYSKSMKGKKS